MNWDDLKLLHAVLTEGSLSAAARRLGTSQPTVGRRMRALEEDLGGPLIERVPDGIRPTPLAQALVPHAQAMQTAADGIARVVKSADPGLHGVVRIACGFFVGRFLAAHLAELVKGAPELEIVLDVSISMVNLDRGDADLAFRNRRPESGNLYAKKIGHHAFAVYGAKSYVEAHPEAHADSRYDACSWVSLDTNQSHLSSVRWLNQRRPRPPKLRCTSSLLLLDAVISGAGLGLLPTYLGQHEGLVQLTEPLEDLGYDGWLVAHRDARDIPRVRHVMDRIAELARTFFPA